MEILTKILKYLLAFMLGFLSCHLIFKQETSTNYQFQQIEAQLNELKNKKDSVINHHETIIKNEKTIINQTFIAIDSLDADSSYQLWTIEARQYRPIFN